MMAVLTLCRLDSILVTVRAALGQVLIAQLLGCNSGIQGHDSLAHQAAAQLAHQPLLVA